MLIVGQNISRIDNLKKQLSKSFAMKDLELAKQILGMSTIRNRCAKKNYSYHKRSTLRKYFKDSIWTRLKQLIVLLLIILS